MTDKKKRGLHINPRYDEKPKILNAYHNTLWIAFGMGILCSIPLWVCIYLIWRLL